tara:strand:+ start:1033 stop:1287 length:255 start_codon:yes stop_codon:yes gene_type:complete
MSNKKKEYLVKDNKVNMEKEGLLKDKYQEVIDFYINSTPYQHLFFLDLIKDRLTFFNVNDHETFEVDEEHTTCFNGMFIQIPIK